MAHSLEMLWHGKYYDIPLDGLAEYDGEKVYFECIDEGGYNYTVNGVISADCPDALVNIINSQVDEEYEFYYNDYSVCCYIDHNNNFPTYEIYKHPNYNIYRMNTKVCEEYIDYIMEFSEKVGYHSWHDDKHKPFNGTNGNWKEYYKNPKQYVIDLNDCELLGTFTSQHFKNFYRK